MRYETDENGITKHYSEYDGELIAKSWYSTCRYCGGRMRHHVLTDGTGGSEYCKDCGYFNDW